MLTPYYSYYVYIIFGRCQPIVMYPDIVIVVIKERGLVKLNGAVVGSSMLAV